MHLSVVRWHLSTSSRLAPALIDPMASRHVVASYVRQPRRCQTSQVRHLIRRHVLSRSSAFNAIAVTVLHSHTPHLVHHHFLLYILWEQRTATPPNFLATTKTRLLPWCPSYQCLSFLLPPSCWPLLSCCRCLAIRRSSTRTPSVHVCPLPADLALVQECFRQCEWLQTKKRFPVTSSHIRWQW